MNRPNKREEWRTLVHVCRRWRTLVFGSPHHLNVRLFCSTTTPVLKKLDIWPALPIAICQHDFRQQKSDNFITAIKHNDRVCEIDFRSFFDKRQLEKILSVMQVPFPALTNLKFTFFVNNRDRTVPVLPDLFLGRSAPRMRHLKLEGFSLPHLLLSTTGLVSLELRRIPHSWYISPDAMVTHLSALTRLNSLVLGFKFRRSRPDLDSHHSPPLTRTLVPALIRLRFEGANEYAEDLVTRIDAPRLENLDITFFNETIFDISHLSQFISRYVKTFQAPAVEARVAFSDDHITSRLSFPAPGYGKLVIGILCNESAGQLSSLIQLCTPLLPTFAMVERLYIYQYGYSWRQLWKHGIQDSHWLQLLHIFPNAKELYVSSEITTYIVPVLKILVGERTAEVLPALQNLFLHGYRPSGPIGQAIENFITARQFSGHPVAVSRWFSH